jgi:hypothetical protein
MDESIVDTMTSVLYGSIVDPDQVRDALLACLDLAPPNDSDARDLRASIEHDPDHSLVEFRMAFARVQARMPSRWVRGSGRIPRVER